MGHAFNIEPRNGVLWAYLSRVIDPSSMPSDPGIFRKLHAECEANECVGILIDVRGVELRLSWPDKIRAALAIAKGHTPGRRVAALADPHSITSNGDFERLAGLAGATLAVFTEEQRALAWVRTPSPSAGADTRS